MTQRASNLTQFVNSYKQIATLPEPNKQMTSVDGLVNKVTKLYAQDNIELSSTLKVNLSIDAIQFEQVLINLIKNAVEATAYLTRCEGDDKTVEDIGRIVIDWQVKDNVFTLTIIDDGTGISNVDNLFVPFYTTKSQGTGIGLVLSRQIIEGDGGKLTLKKI